MRRALLAAAAATTTAAATAAAAAATAAAAVDVASATASATIPTPAALVSPPVDFSGSPSGGSFSGGGSPGSGNNDAAPSSAFRRAFGFGLGAPESTPSRRLEELPATPPRSLRRLLAQVFLNGCCFCVYNQTSFVVLGRVPFVTHATLNVMRRVSKATSDHSLFMHSFICSFTTKPLLFFFFKQRQQRQQQQLKQKQRHVHIFPFLKCPWYVTFARHLNMIRKRQVCIIVVTAWWFATPISSTNALGILLALSGFALFLFHRAQGHGLTLPLPRHAAITAKGLHA
jgi:hypothetical protein